MIRKQKSTIFFLVSILVFLLSCGADEVPVEDTDQFISEISLSELEHTEYFREGALAHILEGELNARGLAMGFHYEGLSSKRGKVIPGTASSPNDFGVYEAEVKVQGVKKTSNGGKSTFFPKEWSPQEVIDAINEAYVVKQLLTGNIYEGLTSEGQVIRLYIDKNGHIISAFPVY